MKRKLLEEAAQELNIFMDLDPKINIKAQIKELKQKVHEAGCLLEEGEQELSISTGQRSGESDNDFEARKVKVQRIQETLKELGVPLFAGTEQGTEVKEAKTNPEEVPQEEGKVSEQEEVTEKETVPEPEEEKVTKGKETIGILEHTALIEMVQKTTKLVDLKSIVEAEEEFGSLRESLDDYTGLQGSKMLKAEMLKVLDVERIPKAEKETAPEKEEGAPKEEDVLVGPKHTALIEMVQKTTKLADLKALVETNDALKELQSVLDMYKGLVGTRELKTTMLAQLGVKKEEGKKPSEKKAKKATKTGKVTKTEQFIAELKEGPKTMAEIKAAEWNDKNSTFYNVFNRLVSEGKAEKDGDKMVLF